MLSNIETENVTVDIRKHEEELILEIDKEMFSIPLEALYGVLNSTTGVECSEIPPKELSK